MVYSIIQKSQLEYNSRIDAEFYEPKYLETEKLIKSCKYNTLEELSKKIVNFGAYSLNNQIEYLDEGYPFLYVGNIKDNYIDLSDVKYIDEKLSKNILHKSLVYEGQVLLTIAGTIGNASVACGLPENTNSNQAIANIYPEDNINPFFLSTFINCKYGKLQSYRHIISNVQPNLLLTQVKKLLVPVFSKEFQDGISALVKSSLEARKNSLELYEQAENLFLEELGLADFEPPQDLTYVVNFSDIENADRMDADYFQPRYDNLISKIKNPSFAKAAKSKQNSKRLGELVSLKKGFEPGSEQYREEGKLFIRVSSLSKNGIEDKDQKHLSEDLYDKLKEEYQPKLGEILLTKDATPGIAYVIKEPIEGIISGGILRLKLKEDIDGEYLTLCINSIVGRMQAERDAGGSVILHWKPEQIKNILIPVLPKEIQQKIADLVVKSHEARRRSKELLDEAKRKVEEMIEAGAGN